MNLMNADKISEPAVEMLSEQSGLWRITQERVAMLRRHESRLSTYNKPIVKAMLDAADSGERFWPCCTEYYSVLNEIRSLIGEPDEDEIEKAYHALVEGSRNDRVDHREWVKIAVRVLDKLRGSE
jgi:hypothetical protein